MFALLKLGFYIGILYFLFLGLRRLFKRSGSDNPQVPQKPSNIKRLIIIILALSIALYLAWAIAFSMSFNY